MARGKVQLKRVEDKASRQVTFSKRRSGLMKKARELSILCDVEVALVTISGNGKVYDFCSGTRLRKVLERYHIHVDPKNDVCCCRADDEAKKDHAEYRNIRTGADLLHMVEREFDEENINQLNMMELMQFEQQVDMTLGQTRFRKAQLMMETITTLHEKENKLREEKQFMEKEIAGKFLENNYCLHEQSQVVELELNKHGDCSAQPLQQAMFRLL